MEDKGGNTVLNTVCDEVEGLIGKHAVRNFLRTYNLLTSQVYNMSPECATEVLEYCGLVEALKRGFEIPENIGGVKLTEEERTVLVMKRMQGFQDKNILMKWVSEHISLVPLLQEK